MSELKRVMTGLWAATQQGTSHQWRRRVDDCSMLHNIGTSVQNWLIFVLWDETPCSLVSFYGILEKHVLSIFRVAKSVRVYTEDGDRKFSTKRPYIATRLHGDKTKKAGFFTVTVVKFHCLWIIKVFLQEKL